MSLLVTPRGNRVYQPDGKVLTDFFWDRSRFACIQGPIGSGTSSASCMKIWVLAMDQEPDFDDVRRTRWIITRDTYKSLRETTVKTWLDWFPEDTWGPFIRSEPMFHQIRRDHPSGDGTKIDCEVIFLAIPDPDVAEAALASYEFTGFFQNEGQFGQKLVTDELLSRCSRYPSMKNGPGATWHGGWMDMNAPVEGHWVPYMRGDIPLPPEMTDDEKSEFEKPDDWRFFVQPPGLIESMVEGKPVYQPNPKAENQKFLKETYMEKVRGKKKSWIDRRVLNKIGLYMHGKSVYPTFSEVDHTSDKEMPVVEGVTVVVGLDGGRDPAASFLQNVGGTWRVLSELIGDNESAALFAPRVKRHAAMLFPGCPLEFWGDPRMLDPNQATEIKAGDVYQNHGMQILPATTDNDVDTRRSTVESVLDRRNGLLINPSCLMTKRALAGGYHYAKIKGAAVLYSPRPVKNSYSHIAEAFENALIGGGEGYALVTNPTREKLKPSPVKKRRVRLARGYR